jgi:hypothetical protein
MELENLLQKGKKYLKRTLAAGLVASSIFFSSCKIDPPPIPPIPPKPPVVNELSEETQILPITYLEEISSVEENSVTFSTSVPYVAGDIIVCNISEATPNGLLRRVISVSEDRTLLHTNQASLEEALKNADFQAQGEVSLKNARSISSKGFEINYGTTFDNVILLNWEGSQVKARGEIFFNSTFYLDFKISDYQLKKLIFKNTTTENSAFQITTVFSHTNEFYRESILRSDYFRPFIAGYLPTVPPFPIIITPELNLYIGASGKILQDMSAIQRTNLTTGLVYERGIGWNLISESYGFLDCFPQTLENTFDSKIFAGARLNFFLYGLMGPYGEIEPYVKITNPLQSPWQLRAGAEVNLGIKMEIFSKTLADYSGNVLDYYKVIAEGEIEDPDPEPEITTVIFQPGPVEGKDAFVELYVSLDKTEQYSGVDGTYLDVNKDYQFTGSEQETLMQFQLFSIPFGSTITSAKLSLYGQGSYLGESDSVIKIKKILQQWEESTVRWDTKPEYGDILSSFTLPKIVGWHEGEITSLVQEWINGETNYGLALLTNYPRPSGEYGFKSSDYTEDITKRPKLEISYY